MSAPMIKHWPLTFSGVEKNELRTQFAALCFREKASKLQVLLVTSRRSGRWILPKGWPILGRSPLETVATEAWEEAGVRGDIADRPVGLFSYTKEISGSPNLPCVAIVYALRVRKQEKTFPESGERRLKWMSRKKAASLVDSRELAYMLKAFDPRVLR